MHQRLQFARRFGRLGKLSDNVADACRTNSFTGQTRVLMADGTTKQIKDVKLGDMVLAADPISGERGPRRVIDLIRHGGLHTMVAVRLADGTTIDATDRHPFCSANREAWVDAIDLDAGDVLVSADGRRLAVASIGVIEQDLTAYNLTICDRCPPTDTRQAGSLPTIKVRRPMRAHGHE